MYYGLYTHSSTPVDLPSGYQFLLYQDHYEINNLDNTIILISIPSYVNVVDFFEKVYKKLDNYNTFHGYFTIEFPNKLWVTPTEVLSNLLRKLPSNVSVLVTLTNDTSVWTKWRAIKETCQKTQSPCPNLALLFSSDINLVKYWRTESFLFIVIAPESLTTNQKNLRILSHPQSLLELNVQQAPLILPTDLNLAYIKWLTKLTSSLTYDLLIDPLQPLTHDLSQDIYHQFEKDENKYNQYQAAMDLAMEDLSSLPRIVVLFVGPGLGKLIDKFFQLEWDPEKVSVYAVEKNINCMEVLNKKNSLVWNGKVILSEGDIREVEIPNVHLVVSELLGSFGDNELCPEILARFETKSRPLIMIPSSYASYLQPVYSKVLTKLDSSEELSKFQVDPGQDNSLSSGIASENLPDLLKASSVQSRSPIIPSSLQRPYLCKLVNYYDLDEFKKVWEFEHLSTESVGFSLDGSLPPTYKKALEIQALVSTSRTNTLRFISLIGCCINGFYGYFSSNLYGHVNITLIGEHSHEICDSWYPILFPVQEERVEAYSEIEFLITRKVTKDKVWYEWDFRGQKYNANGAYYQMDL